MLLRGILLSGGMDRRNKLAWIRRRHVLRLKAKGLRNADIAKELNITPARVGEIIYDDSRIVDYVPYELSQAIYQ
jgi:hypothetical protein